MRAGVGGCPCRVCSLGLLPAARRRLWSSIAFLIHSTCGTSWTGKQGRTLGARRGCLALLAGGGGNPARALTPDATTLFDGTRRLNDAVVQLLDDFSMVSFVPLDITDEESIEELLLQVDMAIQVRGVARARCDSPPPPSPMQLTPSSPAAATSCRRSMARTRSPSCQRLASSQTASPRTATPTTDQRIVDDKQERSTEGWGTKGASRKNRLG